MINQQNQEEVAILLENFLDQYRGFKKEIRLIDDAYVITCTNGEYEDYRPLIMEPMLDGSAKNMNGGRLTINLPFSENLHSKLKNWMNVQVPKVVPHNSRDGSLPTQGGEHELVQSLRTEPSNQEKMDLLRLAAERDRAIDHLREEITAIRTDAVETVYEKEKLKQNNNPKIIAENHYSFSNLIRVGKLDIGSILSIQMQIYNIEHTSNSRTDSYWIDQREVGYLNANDIANGIKLGTDNIQQCVAVIIDGKDKDGERLIALAHVDVHTKPKSLDRVLKRFDSADEQLKIKLYGARDTDFYQDISNSNIQMVEQVLIENGITNFVNSAEEKNSSAEIIYNPQTELLIQGSYSLAGYDTFTIRKSARVLTDKFFGNDSQNLDRRNADLNEINLSVVKNYGECARQIFTQKKQDLYIQSYVNNYADIVEGLDFFYNNTPSSFSTYCINQVAPFFLGVFEALKAKGIDTSLQDLHNGNAIQVITNQITFPDIATPQQNASNNRDNIDYCYQKTDIAAIGRQLVSGISNTIYAGVLENNSHLDLGNIRDQLLNGVRVVGVHNIKDNHWISFCVIRHDGEFGVIYKDSLYYMSREEINLESAFFKKVFGQEIKVFRIKSTEQNEMASSGVLALANMKVFAEQNFHENAINFFTPTSTNELLEKRREFGDLYDNDVREQAHSEALKPKISSRKKDMSWRSYNTNRRRLEVDMLNRHL
jgi:hypothetical protein